MKRRRQVSSRALSLPRPLAQAVFLGVQSAVGHPAGGTGWLPPLRSAALGCHDRSSVTMHDLGAPGQTLFAQPAAHRLTHRHYPCRIAGEVGDQPASTPSRRQDLAQVPDRRPPRAARGRRPPNVRQAVHVNDIRLAASQPSRDSRPCRLRPDATHPFECRDRPRPRLVIGQPAGRRRKLLDLHARLVQLRFQRPAPWRRHRHMMAAPPHSRGKQGQASLGAGGRLR